MIDQIEIKKIYLYERHCLEQLFGRDDILIFR